MNNLVFGMVEILLKNFSENGLFEFLQGNILMLWDEDIPNTKKKEIVIAKAVDVFEDIGPVLVSFLIKFIVTQTRLKTKDTEWKSLF